MATDRRLLENGVDLRLLEDGVSHRLLEDGPRVAGGQIAFPGGYGYGSGGYAGGGAGAGGGGLAGGGQGGAGSGGGGGTGTTTTVPLPFKPGLVIFIMTNQTLGGWRTYASDGTFRWTNVGIASWGDADKNTVFNASAGQGYSAFSGVPSDGNASGGQYIGYCIWIKETNTRPAGAESALAHVTAFHDGGFDLYWDTVAGAGYPIYYIAARDQSSYGDSGTYSIQLDNLVGGQQGGTPGYPQGGLSWFRGLDEANGEIYPGYVNNSVGFWARPDKGNHFTPPGGRDASKHSTHEQGYRYGFDVETGYFFDLPDPLMQLVTSPWIAGSILQGWAYLVTGPGMARYEYNANVPKAFAWATGALNSCYSAPVGNEAGSAVGSIVKQLEYGFIQESTFKPQMGITYSLPISPQSDGNYSLGHAVGIWARQVDDDPSQDFHASVAVGVDWSAGNLVGYHGLDYSWIGEFSVTQPGAVRSAGRLEYSGSPGDLTIHTDIVDLGDCTFQMWLNGVPVGAWVPKLYRWQFS